MALMTHRPSAAPGNAIALLIYQCTDPASTAATCPASDAVAGPAERVCDCELSPMPVLRPHKKEYCMVSDVAYIHRRAASNASTVKAFRATRYGG